uniref:G_PROTEIN_RECEP_F1_2 domain-containing protein n=1 Tax=Ascaris lumbricoides TaxID=6252 RepID=A0A0M3IVU0_ASCLU
MQLHWAVVSLLFYTAGAGTIDKKVPVPDSDRELQRSRVVTITVNALSSVTAVNIVVTYLLTIAAVYKGRILFIALEHRLPTINCLDQRQIGGYPFLVCFSPLERCGKVTY